MKLCLTERVWYCTLELEIFGRSNFHVGQQLFQKQLNVSKARWELFYPARPCVSVRGILGREASIICCRVYFVPEQAPIKCAQGKSILIICTQMKYPCVVDDLNWDAECLSFWIFLLIIHTLKLLRICSTQLITQVIIYLTLHCNWLTFLLTA